MNNTLTFDTGPQRAVYDVNNNTWTITQGEANIFANGISMAGSFGLVTPAGTTNGNFTYTLQGIGQISSFTSVNTWNTFVTTDWPQSIQLSGMGYGYPNWGEGFFESPAPVEDLTLTNGFHLKLTPGILGAKWNGGILGEAFKWTPVDATAYLAASSAPVITNQPIDSLIMAHQTANFSVGCVGTPPLSYQWSLNGTNLAGANFSSLTISNVVPSNLGQYSCLLSNDFGSTQSAVANLFMYPYIAVPFTGATPFWGQDVSFSVKAWGTPPLSYQWFDNGIALPGATNSVLEFTSIQPTNAGLYSVQIANQFGTTNNPAAQVYVNPANFSLGFCPLLTFTGTVGNTVGVYRSTNLLNPNSWQYVASVTFTNANQVWADTAIVASAPSHPALYYKLVAMP